MILANGRFVYVLAELIQELAWSGATQSDETYGRPENSQELYSGFVQIWKTEYLFPHSLSFGTATPCGWAQSYAVLEIHI